MNTKKYALLLLAIIGAGLIYYFTQSKSTIEDEFDIALSGAQEIDEIKIFKGEVRVDLQKVDDQWLLKDFNQASQKKVQSLLYFLESINVSSPVTGPKGQAGKSEASTEGFQISCSKKGKEVYEIFFIQNPKGLNGNFAYRPKHKYLVQLTGNAELNKMLSDEPAFWQSRTIFSVSAENIKEIKVDWGEEMKNFTISANAQNSYDFFRDKSNETAKADQNTVKFYTYEFANVQMDVKSEKYKSLKGELLCTIELTDSDFRKTGASFYQLLNNNNEVDKNQLVVNILNTEVWGRVSYVKMSPILKQADFFLEK